MEQLPALTEHQQKRLWDDLVLAEARTLYFGELATQYHNTQRWLTCGLLVASSAAVAGLLPWLPTWFAPVFSLVTAAVGIYSTVSNYQKKGLDASEISARWSRKAKAYERLWEDMYRDDVLQRLNEIEDSDPELPRAGQALGPYEKDRMVRWQDHVERMRHVLAT